MLSRAGGDLGGEVLDPRPDVVTLVEARVVGGDECALLVASPTLPPLFCLMGPSAEYRAVRCEMNEPMLAPQVPKAAFASVAT